MGQAKRRANKNKQWLDSLTAEERVIADTAEKSLRKFLEPTGSTGMCYRMMFFLHLYLLEKGIKTVPVVGYVNDGSDDVMISHAWLEYNGKKTDVTLASSADPDLNPIGQVIVLDRITRNGCTYSYHLQNSPQGLAVETEYLRDQRSAQIVNMKRAEHSAMLTRARNPSEMRKFLDAAPDKITYEVLKATVDSPLVIRARVVSRRRNPPLYRR
jgi:hypothetical protein